MQQRIEDCQTKPLARKIKHHDVQFVDVSGKPECTDQAQFFFFEMVDQEDQFVSGKDKAATFRSTNKDCIKREMRFSNQDLFEVFREDYLFKRIPPTENATIEVTNQDHLEARFQFGNNPNLLGIGFRLKSGGRDAYILNPFVLAEAVRTHPHLAAGAEENVIRALCELQTGLAIVSSTSNHEPSQHEFTWPASALKQHQLYTFLTLPERSNNCNETLWARYNVFRLLCAFRMILMSPKFAVAVHNTIAKKLLTKPTSDHGTRVTSMLQKYFTGATFAIRPMDYLQDYFYEHASKHIQEKLFK